MVRKEEGREGGIPPARSFAQPAAEPTGAAGEIHRRNFSDLLSSHLLHRRERERERESSIISLLVLHVLLLRFLPPRKTSPPHIYLRTCLTLYRSYHRCIASSLFRHSLNGGSDARFPKFFTAASPALLAAPYLCRSRCQAGVAASVFRVLNPETNSK